MYPLTLDYHVIAFVIAVTTEFVESSARFVLFLRFSHSDLWLQPYQVSNFRRKFSLYTFQSTLIRML